MFVGKSSQVRIYHFALAVWQGHINVALRRRGAAERGRTDTVFLPRDPKSRASANFTTAAYIDCIISKEKSQPFSAAFPIGFTPSSLHALHCVDHIRGVNSCDIDARDAFHAAEKGVGIDFTDEKSPFSEQ